MRWSYQIAKEIGAMAAVLHGRVNAVLFTGGMAHSQRLVSMLSEYVRWIAPIKVYPGEDELQRPDGRRTAGVAA